MWKTLWPANYYAQEANRLRRGLSFNEMWVCDHGGGTVFSTITADAVADGAGDNDTRRKVPFHGS